MRDYLRRRFIVALHLGALGAWTVVMLVREYLRN